MGFNVRSYNIQRIPKSTPLQALITFSDGEDTASARGSQTVLNSAIDNDVVLYSINLQNDNSRELDQLSLATGGLVWSTNEAENITQYVRSISAALSGDFISCDLDVRVSMEPENANSDEIGYGPGGSSFKLGFEFDYELGNNTGVAVNEITMPISPGILVGQTSNSSVYTSDRLNSGSGFNSCINVSSQCSSVGGPRMFNQCTQPVIAGICDSENNCETVSFPGNRGTGRALIIDGLNGQSSYNLAVCPNILSTGSFIPVSATGESPELNYTPYNNGTFQCIYEDRFADSDRARRDLSEDANCPF